MSDGERITKRQFEKAIKLAFGLFLSEGDLFKLSDEEIADKSAEFASYVIKIAEGLYED